MKKATGSGSLLRAQQLEEGEPYGIVWAMGNPGGDHFASHLTPNPGLKSYSLYIEEPCSKLQGMFCPTAVLRADRKEVCYS
jgi:hypothetical protein